MYTLPTLTQHGLVTDKNIIVEQLFKYFVTTQKSQSTIYSDYIESYDYLMKMYNNTPDVLKNKVIDSLTRLYKRYFNKVEVQVVIQGIIMNIDIKVVDNNNNVYTLAADTANKIITTLDNIVKLYD